MTEGLRPRPVAAEDLPEIYAIYAIEVLEGTASFELEPPDLADLRTRLAKIRAAGLPWLALDIGGRLAGYSYATAYRERPAYRFTVEDSVYVAGWARGRGIGHALLEAVVVAAREAGMRQMVAVIGDSANTGSIRLHRACGFVDVGTLRNVGVKFGRQLDTVLMQRAL